MSEPDTLLTRTAALAAGGTVVYAADAPAYWVLAGPEGSEACNCTWQSRDERGV